MTSMLAATAVNHKFESLSAQAKEYEMGICCSCDKEAALRRKIKDRLARNQANVSEWNNMSISGLFFSSEQALLKSN